jgi:DNA-binding NarL/FixJ family response regulator
MRVVLADDDAGMRKALRSLLAEHPDIEVVGDAADGWAAVECARECEPTIVLMDVVMAGMGGIEATRRLHVALPSVQVIAMSLHDDRQFVAAMRRAGASGYLLKDRIHEELAAALRTVADGGNWWSADAKGSG